MLDGDLVFYSASYGIGGGLVEGSIRPISEYTDADHQLAAAMSDYWVAFAATGDPNPLGNSDLPVWPKYEKDTARRLEFGSTIEAGSHLHEARMALWDRFFEVTLP